MFLGVVVFVLSVIGAQNARAQTTFGRLIVFGDSYADNGNLINILTANGIPYPSSGQSPSDSAATQPFVPYPVWLQSLRGMSDSQVLNYAIGGATSQAFNVAGIPYGLQFELASASGQSFSSRDLVTMSIGGNDALFASGVVRGMFGSGPDGSAFDAQQAIDLAKLATRNASDAVRQFAASGARNILVVGFSDLNGLPATAGIPHPDSLALYGQNYYMGLQTSLAPLAQSGVRIFLLDQARLWQRVAANLPVYGFQAYADTPGAQSFFNPDGVHPTSAGFLLEARYMNNLLGAPDTVAAQADLGQTALNYFSGSIFQRLDADRTNNSRSAYAAIPDGKFYRRGTVTSGVEQPLSVYMSGDYASGSRSDRYGATGFNYQLAGGTVGASYKVDHRLTIGGAFNYLNPKANLSLGSGHINLDAYQFATYASFNLPSWFSDFVLAYGRNAYHLDRPGVIDTVGGRTSGDSFSVGFKAGYLFDVASFRIGPIAGLNYANSSIRRYTETGDPLLTFDVSQSKLEALVGSAGVQLRTSILVGSTAVSPYLNLTAEHDFLSGGRTLLSIETQAPLLPIYTKVAGFGDSTYGKIAGGLSARMGDRIHGSLNLAGTFARQAGNDFAVSGQLKIAID